MDKKTSNRNPPYISVILPALNEELTIADCIEEIKSVLKENNISAEIIVSSSSTNRTDEIAENLGARVIRPEKKGYGNAYLFAFKEAFGEIRARLNTREVRSLRQVNSEMQQKKTLSLIELQTKSRSLEQSYRTPLFSDMILTQKTIIRGYFSLKSAALKTLLK